MPPDGVVEIRVLKAGKLRTVSGYFNDGDAAAKAAEYWSGKAPGVYITMNPVSPDLLARYNNRMQTYADATTTDTDVEGRRFLLLDIDAVRRKGIPATQAEHAATLQVAWELSAFLVEQEIPLGSIIVMDSGNGSYLIIRLDLPNDDDARQLVEGVLATADALFSDDTVKIDKSVGNAARLLRLPGTTNCKGDSTPERPHRPAQLLHEPETVTVCPRDALERIAALAPEPEQVQRNIQPASMTFDITTWLTGAGLQVSNVKRWKNATLHQLHECPWNPEHVDTARIVVFDDGRLSAGCFHDSCSDKRWKDLRVMYNTPQCTPQPVPQTAGKSGLHLIGLDGLLAEPAEQVTCVWDLTLPVGGVSVCVAKPKVGKSTLARNLALRIARGDPFLARCTSQGPVVYLALEDKRSELKRHFSEMGATGDEPIQIHVGMAPEEALLALEQAITESGAILAVVDPLFRFLRARDLNDYAIVNALLEPLMSLARDTGCHILTVHHAGKSEREGGDGILGSTAIFGAVDTALILRRRGDGSRTIESVQRYGEDIPKTALCFDEATRTLEAGGTVDALELTKAREGIINLLADGECTEPEIREGVEGRTGMIARALRELHKEGALRREGAGRRADPFLYSRSLVPSIYGEREKQANRETPDDVGEV